jgi:uncharacterized membrane protein
LENRVYIERTTAFQKIWGWVREELDSQTEPSREKAGDPVMGNLEKILETARISIKALNRLTERELVQDKNKYEFTKDQLEQIISFEEFSLAEYTFCLTDNRRPGVRILLGARGFTRTVQVIQFADVVQWHIDSQGNRLNESVLTLNVSSEIPEVIQTLDMEGLTGGWRSRVVKSVIRSGLPAKAFKQPELLV